MTDPNPSRSESFIPATDEQIDRALGAADGALAAASIVLSPEDKTASDAEIAAAMRGQISFDEAVAAGLARARALDRSNTRKDTP